MGIIDQALESFMAGKVVTVAICFIIYYLFKSDYFKMFVYFSEKRYRENEEIKSLLLINDLGSETKEFLLKSIEEYAFYMRYKINAPYDMAKELIKFQNDNKEVISWLDIERAYHNIKWSGSKIIAKLTIADHFFRWLFSFLSLFIGITAIASLIYMIFYSLDDSKKFYSLAFLTIFLIVVSCVISSMNWPYHSTKKIIAQLKIEGE